MLTTELGTAYGEGKLLGTPYVKHIRLAGGGLCAQAVCFMANAILHEHASAVYGLAEATVFAHGAEEGEVLLQGLKFDGITRYLSSPFVNLRAVWQRAVKYSMEDAWLSFQLATRAYLASGMPVIVPVDSGRMEGHASPECPLMFPSIVETNQIRKSRTIKPGGLRPLHHAVLLVGYDPDGEKFVFNDPSRFPFMQATVGQILDCAVYAPDDLTKQLRHVFCPVTPSRIRMTLQESHSPGAAGPEHDYRLGLIKLAQRIQVPWRRMKLPPVPVPYRPGDLRLVQLEDIPQQEAVAGQARHALQESVQLLIDELVPGTKWCWLQAFPDSLWVWDAERDPPTRAELLGKRADQLAAEFLLCVVAVENGAWARQYLGQRRPTPPTADGSAGGSDKSEGQATNQAESAPLPFKASVMTSFLVEGGIKALVRNWPKEAKFAELYAFMQDDARRFLRRSLALVTRDGVQFLSFTLWHWLTNVPPRWGKAGEPVAVIWPVCNAVDRMAAHSDNARQIRKAASEIAGCFRKTGTSIVALASFAPEIASEDNPTGVKALVFLGRLAGELQALGHPARTIEMVSGSRIDGVWPATRRESVPKAERNVYVANLITADEGIERLIKGLKQVVEQVGNIDVQFAVELEPGPMFVVGGWDSLGDFCRAVSQEPTLSSRVGVNLDVAHWALAGIEHQSVRESQDVLDRIVHCHASDHGRGHFGDVEISAIHPLTYFQQWVRMVTPFQRDGAREGVLLYSGFVSIELEACKYLRAVSSSFGTLCGSILQ